MTKRQNLAASLWEGRRLRTIGDLARGLKTESDGTWSAHTEDTAATIKDIVGSDGASTGLEVHVKRTTLGTLVTRDIMIEFGEFDSTKPTVDATLYDGGDYATGDRPTKYSSVDRAHNETMLGLPAGLGRIVGALELVTRLQLETGQSSFVDDYSAAEKLMLDEK